ncbi:uncharacterized protein SCODWIG_00869 [Saccharomycodes ludwigii]|uniref:Uncharacterized protein n=1 Tax=Saccharomycodes ludwigii TaxID=36035 RepID=A0A376B341_9ASCO|nr:uncharacterized protein SCODWIG_00869 [Saccharomycodes ludwigii]
MGLTKIVVFLIITAITFWLFSYILIDSKKEPTSLDLQAWVGDTRKEGETALYRNLSTPFSTSLLNGLNLRVKDKPYQYRRGNFADVWQCCMDLYYDTDTKDINKKGENYITFEQQHQHGGQLKKSLETIDLDTMNVFKFFQSYFEGIKGDSNNQKKLVIGITIPVYKYYGFIVAVGSFISSLLLNMEEKRNILEIRFLSSPPRKDENIDVIFVDTWSNVGKMKQSLEWYKLLVVGDSCANDPESFSDKNIISIDDILQTQNSTRFKYVQPQNYKLHDDDVLFKYENNTVFTQMNLVSAISSYVVSFPQDHQLSSKDVVQFIFDEDNGNDLKHSFIQIWPKLLAVLMHGGSVIFTSTRFKIEPQTTLLVLGVESYKTKLLSLIDKMNIIQSLRFMWASNFFSEGVFSKSGSMLPKNGNFQLRCIYMAINVHNSDKCNDFDDTDFISSIKDGKVPVDKNQIHITSLDMTRIRALFGSRLVLETFVGTLILGPVFQSNYYDYRIFPPGVEDKLQFCGVITSSLEAKLIEFEGNDDDKSSEKLFKAEKRQGLLLVRGYTIGKPCSEVLLQRALKLSEKFDPSRDAWMPLVGVVGVWGKDQCFYEF